MILARFTIYLIRATCHIISLIHQAVYGRPWPGKFDPKNPAPSAIYDAVQFFQKFVVEARARRKANVFFDTASASHLLMARRKVSTQASSSVSFTYVPVNVRCRRLGHYTTVVSLLHTCIHSRAGAHIFLLFNPSQLRHMTGLTMAFVSPFVMTVGGGAGSDSGAGGVGGRNGSVPRSRLSEFSFAGGDRGVQSELVREVMKRAAEVGLTDAIDGKIAEFEGGAKTNMHGILYVTDIRASPWRPSWALCFARPGDAIDRTYL